MMAVLSMTNIAAAIIVTSPINGQIFSSNIVPISYNLIDVNSPNISYVCGYITQNQTFPIICSNNTFNYMGIYGLNTLNFFVNRSDLTSGTSTTVSTPISFSIDNIPPVINIISPTSNGYYGNSSLGLNNLTYNISESNPCSYWIFNGTANLTAPSTCINTTFNNIYMFVGSNTWTIYARDSYNNLASSSVSFTYDPVYPVLNSLNINMYEDYVKFNYQATEDIIMSIRYGTNLSTSLNKTENTTTYDDSRSLELEGLINNTIYYYNITITDKAYNRVTYGPFNFTFNSTITVSTTNYSCYTDAICGAWGACSATGLQTRVCNKINISCGYSTTPITTQTCSYAVQTQPPLTTTAPVENISSNSTSGVFSKISDGWKMAIIIGCIIIIIVGGVLIFLRYQNPTSDEIVQAPYEQTYDPTQDTKYNKGTSYSDNPDDYLDDNRR
jgi:hypothetical protein